MKKLIILIGVLLIPLAQGTHLNPHDNTQGNDYRQLSINEDTLSQGGINWGATITLTSFEVREITNYTVHNRDVILKFQITPQILQVSNGLGQMNILVDGVNVPNCAFRILTNQPSTQGAFGVLLPIAGFSLTYHYAFECEVLDSQKPLGSHTVTMATSVVSGTPSQISELFVAYQAIQIDYINVTLPSGNDGNGDSGNMTGLPSDFAVENVTFLWLFLFFVGVLLLAEWKQDIFYFFLAMTIGIYVVIALPDFMIIPRVFLIAVMVYQAYHIWRINQSARGELNN